MKTKPKTPYQRLLEQMQKAWDEVEYPHRVLMLKYRKADFEALWQRVEAARQLSYDVVLEAQDNELAVIYRKEIPTRPIGLCS